MECWLGGVLVARHIHQLPALPRISVQPLRAGHCTQQRWAGIATGEEQSHGAHRGSQGTQVPLCKQGRQQEDLSRATAGEGNVLQAEGSAQPLLTEADEKLQSQFMARQSEDPLQKQIVRAESK